MESFIAAHRDEVKGVLRGFDRVRFRGTLRMIANTRGLMNFLWWLQIRLTEFKDYVRGLTDTVREATEKLAAAAGRPVIYLASSAVRKEERARDIAAADRIDEGLVCVLTCVEPCRTFTVGPNAQTKKLELRPLAGKCLHQYFYLRHARLGWLHVRLQTWLPFTIHVCLNGRDWLAQQLTQAGLGFVQQDNCFTDLEDVARTQALADRQLRTPWDKLLNGLVAQVHPRHRRLFAPHPLHYYWSADETEWATDVLFRSRAALAPLYARLVRHGIQTFGATDVLRFLGRRACLSHDACQVQSSLKQRPEGVRLKHQVNRNALKMYDKQDTVLRVETTINDPRDLKVYRTKENDPEGPMSWQRLRKGVADLHRRAQVSDAANSRYYDGLAAVEVQEALGETARDLCQPTTWQGRRVRALNPLNPDDARLLEAVARGEFALHGFRNRDLRGLLFASAEVEPALRRSQAAKVTRLIRLLRAHQLVKRVASTHRYVLTDEGRKAITACLTARQANTSQLAELAA